jgi:hypothetical protein
MMFREDSFFESEGIEVFHLGKILKHMGSNYIIEWNHFPGKYYAYDSKEVDQVWKPTYKSFLSTVDVNSIILDPSVCGHDWKTYQGFSEAYEFCTLCPKKRPLY